MWLVFLQAVTSFIARNPIRLVNSYNRILLAQLMSTSQTIADDKISLKTQLLNVLSTCDRGFGATLNDKELIYKLVDELKYLCDNSNLTQGLYPNNNISDVPVEGVWKLGFTNAYDVVSLAANPLTQLQGIYQVSLFIL